MSFLSKNCNWESLTLIYVMTLGWLRIPMIVLPSSDNKLGMVWMMD